MKNKAQTIAIRTITKATINQGDLRVEIALVKNPVKCVT
jgi:hypothetical protein